MAKRAANCHEAICNGEPVEAFEGKKISFIRGEYLLRDDNLLLDCPDKYRRVEKYLLKLYAIHPDAKYRFSDLDSGEMLIAGFFDCCFEKNTITGNRGHRNKSFLAHHYKLEFELLKRISDSLSLPLLKLIVPFISSLQELYNIRDGLNISSHKIQIIPMIETPGLLDEILSAEMLQFDEVVVGLNDLTSLYYGMTREKNSINVGDVLYQKLLQLVDKKLKVTLAGNIRSETIQNADDTFPLAMHLWNGWNDNLARERVTKIKELALQLKHDYFKRKVVENENFRIYTIYEKNNINK
ncbi:putative PEP-binding protein [Erwinia mallotivora]|uniref:PEP-utilising enzyme C-terminal domain-containing protein n=1 Tax=Erwinia mallotivora TaxID=69222 RepID=A0A014NR40_9GAMM|nr:putative PEP-binding protein [Erwinia mallotivora]EXU76290.1 hypothetical protein BG55_06245 [Erwinia mallotivora]